MSSLSDKTARGAAWTIVSSLGARAIGVAGTVVMTHLLEPDVVGAVNDAMIIALTANWMSIWGFNQYVIVKGRGPDSREVTFHVTVAHIVMAIVGLGLVAAFGGRLAPVFNAPMAARFVPGMALSMFIRRIGSTAEKVLIRNMKFRAIAMQTAAGEVTYGFVAVYFAWRGYGGDAIIIGNIVQSTVMVAIVIAAAGWSSWATPVKLRWSRFRDMTRFGVPLSIQAVAHNASRYWDNLTVSHFFDAGAAGLYNMAYNLADIPAVHVGEQLASVLLPSFARLAPERRPRALERATALLSLLIFPMAIGLGLIAKPLIAVALSPEWQGVAPLLTVLSALSVFRPITWVVSTYMESNLQTGRYMWLEIVKLFVLLGAIAILSRWGLLWAAGGVGVAFGFAAIAGVWLVVKDGPSPARVARGFLQPLAACGVMVVAVLGLRHVLEGNVAPWIDLLAEMAAGAISYVIAALILCRDTAKDFLSLAKGVLKGKRGGAAPDPDDDLD
ncbi:MAG TPA: oligosaccharide flippase family protein [Kofleriaceae bacterium]|nr:oligosaccharide flippase family protein [Kofleriaceae bacterium]